MIYFDSDMSKSTNTVVFFDLKTVIDFLYVDLTLDGNHLFLKGQRVFFLPRFVKLASTFSIRSF
jgi:hypothetical protein